MSETIDSVTEFWFGNAQSATAVSAEKQTLWWGKSRATDQLIRQRFAALSHAVHAGQKPTWRQSPRGLLAMILCTDQFPRNIHRDTAAAFAYDATALSLAQHCVASGTAAQLRNIEQVFVYLPFEHSESLDMQQRSLEYYQTLVDTAAAAEKPLFENFYQFAQKHFDIIQRFGRFPHRNALLDRTSTAAERDFLTQPGSSF